MSARSKSVTKIAASIGYEQAATVRIKHAAEMSKAGRRSVAKWLRATADNLEKEGNNYSAGFVARYYYRKSRRKAK